MEKNDQKLVQKSEITPKIQINEPIYFKNAKTNTFETKKIESFHFYKSISGKPIIFYSSNSLKEIGKKHNHEVPKLISQSTLDLSNAKYDVFVPSYLKYSVKLLHTLRKTLQW